MSFRVRLTDTAKQDIQDITLWIADQSKDIAIAKAFAIELKETCRKLQVFPDRGSFPKDHILKSMGYRFIVYKDYLIVYVIDEEKKTVDIMSVFNAKKDYTRILKRLL